MSRTPSPVLGRRTVLAMDAELRDEERRAKRLAATFGPCAKCGVDVGPDGIHAWNCPAVATERRANGGRPNCTGFRCKDGAVTYSSDFGWLCDHHLAMASNTTGT